MEQVYSNHIDLLESRQALHIAFRILTLKAWNVNPPSSSVGIPEQNFISTLRSRNTGQSETRRVVDDSRATSSGLGSHKTSSNGSNTMINCSSDFDILSGDMGLDIGSDFNLDTQDWTLWDQLIKNDQSQGG